MSKINPIILLAGLSEDIGKKFETILNEKQIDIVIHLAAKAGVRPSIEDPAGYSDVNINGTMVMLEAMRKAGVKKFIFASSSSVYGNNEKIPFSETDNVDFPISPYAATKKAGELICHTYSYLYDIDITCLRFFTVYGPRQRPDMAIHKFVKAILNGDEITVFGDGTQTRDFTFVDDVTEANILAANNEMEGVVFNVGGGSRITVNKLIELLEKITERNAKIEYIEKQKGDVLDTLADTSKISNKLNWKPEVKIEEGAKRFVKWYKTRV